jgi:hypothetical protein
MHLVVFCEPIKLSESLLAHVERRFGFALERVKGRVEEVRIRLSFFHREGAGIARECRARVLVDGMGDVVVADEDGDLKTAIDRAADKAGDAVARALEQELTAFRTRRPARLGTGRPKAARKPEKARNGSVRH